MRGARGDTVGSINEEQLREIATKKLPDLNTSDVTTAMRIVAGQASNMGITIDWDAFHKPKGEELAAAAA